MREFIVLPIAVVAVLALAGCDTLESDWDNYDRSAWNSGWSAPSGDNRSHEQQLRDEAWWDDYHRAN
jgi:hypothetical protein